MKKNGAIGGNYKFQHLKTFGSTENLYRNEKKYRKVFDESEARYVYAELAFYNKLFDEEDWAVNAELVCYKRVEDGDDEKVCTLTKNITVSRDRNIVYIREGWGTPEPGWWKQGAYRWEAFLDGEKVGDTRFFITEGGEVSAEENPFFEIRHVRLFESGRAGLALDERKYLKTFSQVGTRYINVELTIDFKEEHPNFPLELQFNFYNDVGQHKAYMEYFKEIKSEQQAATFDTGYGAEKGNYWFPDNYTLEVLFMDTLIAVIPFVVSDEEELQPGFNMPFTVHARKVLRDDTLENAEKTEDAPKKLSFEEATKQLNALIGLGEVKRQVDEFSTYLQFLQVRKTKGFKESDRFNMHAMFTGNPGTGKTTVAKMLGQIYHSLDLLTKGHVHEVGRADLVAEYIGQTAPKVKKAIEKARGGILFIDEAYALTDRGDDEKDFGKEVLEVLIKEMSDGPGDIAFIFAGYPNEMDAFIAKNPGMQSRVQTKIHFPDYTPDELMAIATYAADQRDVTIAEDAQAFMHVRVVEAYRNRDNHFGNARFIHGIVEESKQNMAIRLMRTHENINELDKEELSTLRLEDLEKTFGMERKPTVAIPIDEALLTESLEELHTLIGLDSVKKDVDEMVKLVRYYTEIGRDVKKAFSLHSVFTGNPGTGKTTVARILVKIYKALGVLERGHLVECDRKALVAGYTGQTAIKTAAMIDKAIGGGLFIDEAYALTNNHDGFGQEAVDTLLKRMEDQRGEFMVIVAGYPVEMQQFLESNPGLLSRFDKNLKFVDYNAAQLIQIAESMFESENLTLSPEAAEHLSQYVHKLLEHKHRYFGNARTVRKVVREVVRRQNLRLASMPATSRNAQKIQTVELVDIKDFKLFEQRDEQRKGIGFR